MIELRKYEHMHDCISCTQSSKRKRIYGPSQSGGGGRIYEIKPYAVYNLAPKEGGAFIRGGRIIEQVRYMTGKGVNIFHGSGQKRFLNSNNNCIHMYNNYVRDSCNLKSTLHNLGISLPNHNLGISLSHGAYI